MLLPPFLKRTIILFFFFLALSACSSKDEAGDILEPSNTIIDFVESNPNYSSFNAALHAADLKTLLSGEKIYTVFAPNNAAFNTFLSDNNYPGLDAVPVELLRQILLNHVQEGAIFSGDLSTGYLNSMASGKASKENLSMYINTEDGVVINGVATVTNPNFEVQNGVIHAINAVLDLPDITSFVNADPTFDILVAALTREDEFELMTTLQMQELPAPFTFFAPTNNAFVDLLEEMELESVEELSSEVLASILRYHIIPEANIRSGDVTDGMEISTLNSGRLTINTGTNLTITDANTRMANILTVDVQGVNGVIQIIDTVLLPLK